MTTDLISAFLRNIRERTPVVGYWVVLDSPVSTERVAGLGYDYICLDGQHGLLGYSGILSGLMAIDARNVSVGLVRVESNDSTVIGRALDAGAVGVIVPLIDTAADAASAVAASQYQPRGTRSYGPMRSGLRISRVPAETNASTLVFAMIETAAGLENVDEICATPGLAGVYVGPSDLSLALGALYPGDPSIEVPFVAALARIRKAAERSGIAAGIHTTSGADAAKRLAEGFTFASIAADLNHLEEAAAQQLRASRSS
jgi:4-hydroxy-2-oxoheptanedioate aldolase